MTQLRQWWVGVQTPLLLEGAFALTVPVALLERYDAAITDTPSKIDTGIVRFERRINVGAGFATPGFWVERTDGSCTDFSFPTAKSSSPQTISALR